MTILVTGGCGFIGSAVCRQLLLAGETVVNVDAMTYAASPDTLRSFDGQAGFHFHRADIRDRAAIDAILARHQPSAILNLAAESHVDRSIDRPASFLDTNVVGTSVLLDAARNLFARAAPSAREGFRFVQVSTDEVYGSLGAEGAFDEASPYDPSSPYSASKAAAELIARAWGRTYGIPVIVTNCSNNYGPFQFPEKLVALSIASAVEERPISVYGDGGNVRDWLHVDDHARGLILAMRHGRVGEKYNFGGSAERTNLQMVQAICAILDRLRPRGAPHSRLIRFVADRPGHDWRYAVSAAKAEKELGWTPAESFDSGLEKTVRWYLDNPDWWGKLRQQVYDGARLGLAGRNG